MLNICSLFQKFFGFIKSIQKKTYRNCMVVISGIVLVSVICLNARDFGGSGKNNVSRNCEMSENETDTDTDETDANAVVQDSNKHASIVPLDTEQLALSNVFAQNAESQTSEEHTSEVETTTVVETTTQAGPETTTEGVIEEIVEETTEEETVAAYTNVDFEITESDYYWLTRIVEAEAGDQDEIGKILVVNVIVNRVKSDRFPNTIKSVIFQNDGRTYQFEPVKNERIYDMNPTDSTIECVNRALNGEDYSEGALFFTMKTSSGSWFNTSLTFLFVHGAHYFYTY